MVVYRSAGAIVLLPVVIVGTEMLLNVVTSSFSDAATDVPLLFTLRSASLTALV